MAFTFFDIDGKREGTWHGLRAFVAFTEDKADEIGCDPDDFNVHDVYWGGECGEDNTLDVVTLRGELFGSLDYIISPDEMDFVKKATAERIAEKAAFRNVRAA